MKGEGRGRAGGEGREGRVVRRLVHFKPFAL